MTTTRRERQPGEPDIYKKSAGDKVEVHFHGGGRVHGEITGQTYYPYDDQHLSLQRSDTGDTMRVNMRDVKYWKTGPRPRPSPRERR